MVECGLGGRLDSTNVLSGAVCVVTGIDLEHTAILGADRASIAAEKAGILKPGSTLVSGVDPGDEAGRVVAHVPLPARSGAGAVALGRVRRVVTHTERSYRSWSPLHFRCPECVIEKGTLTSQKTEVVSEGTFELDPSRYRVESRLTATVAPVRSGTRVELLLEVRAEPRDPPELEPRSTGLLERAILDDVGTLLLR